MNGAAPTNPQTLAAAALVTLTVVLCGAVLARPLIVLHQSRERDIAAQHAQAEKFRAAADSRTTIERRLDGLKHDPHIAAAHLKQTVPALAAAELQQHIQRLAQRHGARVISMQALGDVPVGAADAADTVTVRLRLQSDNAALMKLLFALESENPRVSLDNFVVRALGATGHDNAARNNVAQPLDIGFDASGFLLSVPR